MANKFHYVVPTHKTRLYMLVLRIALGSFVLLLAVKGVNRWFKTDNHFHGNRIAAAILVMTSISLLDTAFLLAVDFATESLVAESGVLLFGRAALKLIVYVLLFALILAMALQGNWKYRFAVLGVSTLMIQSLAAVLTPLVILLLVIFGG